MQSMGTTFRNKIPFLSLTVLCFFPVYPHALISITSGLFLALVLSTNFLLKETKKKPLTTSLIIEVTFYIILCFSILYTEDDENGIKVLFRLVPLLVFPIVVGSSKMGKLTLREYNLIKWFFIYSNLLIGIFIVLKGFYLQSTTGVAFYNSLKDIAKEDIIVDFHPTYISMFLTMSIFLLLDFPIKKYEFKKQIVIYGLILFFGSLIALLSSRVIILCLFLGIIIYIPKKKWKVFFIISFFAMAFFLTKYVEPLRYQFNDIINSELVMPTEKFPSSIKVRYAINHCSWKSIQENLFLGVGIGDFQAELEECYKTLETEALSRHNYNSHNFYFFLWGSAGIFSVLAFVILIFFKIIRAMSMKNKVQIVFWLMIFLSNITESVLVRSYGITFFVFFVTLFYVSNQNEFSFRDNSSI